MEDCPCVGKHIPKAMQMSRHHIWPLEEGGSDTSSNTITLCPTTHQNIDKLWYLYDQYNGRPPWTVLREYSEFARVIVERGRELRRAARVRTNQADETIANTKRMEIV